MEVAAYLRKSSAIWVSECAGTVFKRTISIISLVCEMENHESHVCYKCGIKDYVMYQILVVMAHFSARKQCYT